MNKKVVFSKSPFWLAVMLICSVFVGLFGGAKPTQAADKTTITYGIWDSRQEPGLRKIADDFEKANPDIKVDIQVTGWDDYWTMLEAAATGGSLPDVFWMHSNVIYKYGANNQLMPLDDLIKEAGVDLGKFPKGLVDIYNVEGKQYGIPKDFDTIGLWYNKKMFDEAGLKYPDATWTWDTLKEAAKKLTKEDKSQYGASFFFTNQEGFYNFIYQNGGTVLTADRKSGYADPKTIEALEYYFSFVKEGLSPASYKDEDGKAFLENGKAAMGLLGSWQMGSMMQKDYVKANFDVAPLPAKDGKRTSIFNGLANVMAANTQHKDAAWKFIQYLSSKEAQDKASQLGVAISAYEGSEKEWLSSNKDLNLKAYTDAVEGAQIRPYTDDTVKWEEKVYEILKGAYTGEKDTAEAAKEAAKVMDQLISEEK